MDKPLKFWNGEKIQKNIFNDSLGNVIKFAIWTGSKSSSVIRACVIKRHVYKIVTMRDKEGISDNNNKKYEFKLPDGEENILGGTQTVDWNPEHESQIAVGMANSYVLHWNIETAKCIRMHKAIYENTSTLSRTLTCIQWSRKDPNILIYGTKDPIIKVWDVRQEGTVQEKILDGVLDIKFDPFDGNQFAVASENHDVMIYDLRYPTIEKTRSDKKPQVSKKFKFSAHENRTLKCEWNPNIRNRLATSGQNNIKIWDLDYSKESHLQQEHTRITTRHSAYSIKWSPLCENLLASHSHSSKYVEIWDINRRFRPYRHFKEEPTCKDGWHHQSKLGKLLLHWHESPHALITLNTSNADLSMHARRDAINMENFAPSCAVACSPHHEMAFTVTPYKANKRIPTSHHDTVSDRSFLFTKPLSPEDNFSETFCYFALNYTFTGDSLHKLCLKNAKIAEDIGLLDIASNWKLLHILHASSETTLPFHVEESNFENQRRPKRSGTVSSGRHFLTSESQEECLEQETDSDQLIHYRNPVSDVEYRAPSYHGPPESEYRGHSYPASEEDNSEHDDFNHEQSVKNYQWEMLDVPFVSQETVPNLDHSTECEDIQSDMSSIPDPEVGGLYSSNNFHQDNMTSVRHNKTDMRINTSTLTQGMLEELVREGNVQTACTMLLLLGNKLDKCLEPGDEQAVAWFHAYVDLLSRFKLWSVQAAVIAEAPEQIKMMNGRSLISAICPRCTTEKLRDGVCGECGPVAVCSLCRLAVRGLYVWCQGCCHGGHLDHLELWFSKHRQCPAACGHECQFS